MPQGIVVVVVVLAGTMVASVASVGHLIIVKRFEIQVKDLDTRSPTKMSL
jgi:hypothetical protein